MFNKRYMQQRYMQQRYMQQMYMQYCYMHIVFNKWYMQGSLYHSFIEVNIFSGLKMTFYLDWISSKYLKTTTLEQQICMEPLEDLDFRRDEPSFCFPLPSLVFLAQCIVRYYI